MILPAAIKKLKRRRAPTSCPTTSSRRRVYIIDEMFIAMFNIRERHLVTQA